MSRSRVGTVAEAAVDSLTAGRDAALLQAEQIATAALLHRACPID
jgi:hypothetical protein